MMLSDLLRYVATLKGRFFMYALRAKARIRNTHYLEFSYDGREEELDILHVAWIEAVKSKCVVVYEFMGCLVTIDGTKNYVDSPKKDVNCL